MNLSVQRRIKNMNDGAVKRDVWNVDGAIASVSAERIDPYDLVLHLTCARPTGVAVAAGQLVFGAHLALGGDPAAQPYYFDSSVSVETVVPHSAGHEAGRIGTLREPGLAVSTQSVTALPQR